MKTTTKQTVGIALKIAVSMHFAFCLISCNGGLKGTTWDGPIMHGGWVELTFENNNQAIITTYHNGNAIRQISRWKYKKSKIEFFDAECNGFMNQGTISLTSDNGIERARLKKK